MHTREARADGESDLRIDLLPAWREASCYTDRERVALGWTEALTLVADRHAPEVDFEPLRGPFSEREIVALSLAIVTINGRNRLAIGFRTPPMARKA